MAKRVAFTVYYDDDSGELADVRESPLFRSENTTMRLDIYQDALDAVATRCEQANDRQMAYLMGLREGLRDVPTKQ